MFCEAVNGARAKEGEGPPGRTLDQFHDAARRGTSSHTNTTPVLSLMYLLKIVLGAGGQYRAVDIRGK